MNIKKGNRGNRAKSELGCPWIRKIEKEHKEKRKKKENLGAHLHSHQAGVRNEVEFSLW